METHNDIIGLDLSHFQCTDGSYLLTTECLVAHSDDKVLDIILSLFGNRPKFKGILTSN